MNDKTHFAVVVGINKYPAIRDLNSPRGDAEKFHDWLTDLTKGGLDPVNAKLITVNDATASNDRSTATPTIKMFCDALDEMQSKCEKHVAANPADWIKTRLYVYVSGHGIAPTAREAALLMADAGPPRYFSNNFSCDKYMEYFETSQTFHELVFFADCCREHVGAAQAMGPPWDEIEGNNGDVITCPGYATYFGEFAFEPSGNDNDDPDKQRSYFTRALLEGLNGQAAIKGKIDSNTLSDYVVTRVQKLTEDKRIPQRPQMKGEHASPIIFRENLNTAKMLQLKTHSVKIKFPAGYNGNVCLRDSHFKELGQHDSAIGDWVLELSNSLYEVEATTGGVQFVNDGLFKVQGEDCDVQL